MSACGSFFLPSLWRWQRASWASCPVCRRVSGCCIGAGITRDQIFQLRQLILPALVLIAGYILVCVGMGRAISRAFRMDLKESMLSLSPAGATEMALIAADLGVHSTNLVVLQICRLLGVTVIFPQIFALLSNLIG